MKTKALMIPLRALNPFRMTGPIFDKELRVSSRRKRNYVLRFAYLAILLTVILFIWEMEVRWGYGNVAYQASRLSQAGLLITGAVVAVQFYVAQILSIIMLSNSISDEVYNKTLGALMSTPINSFQIVMGKLLSKLLQIALLICVTLPILAIVRVFGGVPWDFLLTSLCVTFTAVLFAAMVSLNLSISHKHAYMVIIMGFLRLIILYFAVPLFAVWTAYQYFGINQNTAIEWIALVNPLFVMQILLTDLFNPGGIGIQMFPWGWHCLFMLACSAILFIRAVIVVRKKALQQACGQTQTSKRKWKLWPASHKNEKIRRVKGKPLVWKEMTRSAINMTTGKKVLLAAAVIGCTLYSYYMCYREGMFKYGDMHILYGMVFMTLGIFISTVFAATSITSDKVSRTLPVLLTTLISDWQIITAKAVGVFRRTIPIWTLLFGHIILFIFLRQIHPSALFQIAIIVFGAMIFVTSSGLFFSSLLKSTTGAVIANLIFVAFVWGGILIVTGMFSVLAGMNEDLIELVAAVNPFFHIGMVLDEAAGRTGNGAIRSLSQMEYDCLIMRPGFWGTTFFLTFTTAAYTAASFLMLKLAEGNLRRKLF